MVNIKGSHSLLQIVIKNDGINMTANKAPEKMERMEKENQNVPKQPFLPILYKILRLLQGGDT